MTEYTAMESADQLPETLEALKACEKELGAFLKPLHRELNAAKTKKQWRSIKEQILPSFQKLKAVKSKIKELEQTATSPELTAESPPSDQQKEGTAPDADQKADSQINEQQNVDTVDGTDNVNDDELKVDNQSTTETAAGPSTPFPVDSPQASQSAAMENFQDPDAPGSGDFAKPPPWIKPSFVPKPPKKNDPGNHAVLRFVADGKVHCFGHLDKPSNENTVKVMPIIKIPRADDPFFGIRVMFPRDRYSKSKAQFTNLKHHVVLLRFKHKTFTVDDHLVEDKAEFEDFLEHAPKHCREKALEAKEQGKLYRIIFSYEDEAIDQVFYPHVYSSAVPQIQQLYDTLALVRGCKTLSVYMWMYDGLRENLQFLYQEQQWFVSPLKPYEPIQLGTAAYVQWGKIVIPESEEDFNVRMTFDKYSDFDLIVGNGVAREKLKEVDIIKKVRSYPVKMTITQAGPDEQYYVCFLQFRDFAEAKKVILGAGTGLVTWEPPPKVKPQSELAQGERPARDNPDGWRAWVITDSMLQHGADVMIFLRRPSELEDNKYRDHKMPDVAKEGEKLQHQFVYYKIRIEIETTKQLIKAVGKLRPKETQGNTEAQMQRAVICGRDGTVYRTTDILEGVSEADIASFLSRWSLTPSQHDFIFSYCRHIHNGLAILQGPAGSGKTTIIKTLLEIAVHRGLKVAIVTDSNSAADTVIEKIADMDHIAVRLHSLGLERRHLIKESRKDIQMDQLQPADPEPDSDAPDKEDDKPFISAPSDYVDNGAESFVPAHDESEHEPDADPKDTEGARMPTPSPHPQVEAEVEEDLASGWKDDQFSLTYTKLVLEEAQAKYEKAKLIMSPEDPRMKMLDSALWTYLLKVLGILNKDEHAKVVNDILERLATKGIFKEFRGLLLKSKTQVLNQKEWTRFGKLIESCCSMFLKDAAHATVCTIAQLANEWAKDVKFDWVIVDEGTRISEAQMVQIWRPESTLIQIGDQMQLAPTILSKPKDNPFTRQFQVSPYERFVNNNHPFFLLLEVMRSTAGN